MIDAVHTLADPDSPDFAAAVRELIHAGDPEVDRMVMDVYEKADNDAVGAQAARILALRDPDRDPEYALARFRTTGSFLTKPFRRVVENAVYRLPPHQRLRHLPPDQG